MTGFALAGRLETLLMEPPVTPEAFCAAQPCVPVRAFGTEFILNQPASSALVFALGALWVWAGMAFLRSRGGEASRAWWGAALVLGGAAALCAGVSYQAFGYAIKCAGREACVWTSWWEVAYLVLQAGSMNAMLAALAHACASGRARRALLWYAGLNAGAHVCLTAVGALVPVRFLVSFELMVLFAAPGLVIFFAVCGRRYARYRQVMDRWLLAAGVWLVIAIAAYFAYMTLGLTQALWARGVWFSDNDVLHVFMIVWIALVARTLGPELKDAPAK